MNKMREIAIEKRNQGSDNYVYLTAVDPYGEVIFNYLQVERFMSEIEAAAVMLPSAPSLGKLLNELRDVAVLVGERCWFIHILGD